ncbi:MAG: hypothetical protein GKR94_13950 [Gammaproteobacteria bacterium]|nr:hypothetical protein [Gammaproteobacteria bacterium]
MHEPLQPLDIAVEKTAVVHSLLHAAAVQRPSAQCTLSPGKQQSRVAMSAPHQMLQLVLQSRLI